MFGIGLAKLHATPIRRCDQEWLENSLWII